MKSNNYSVSKLLAEVVRHPKRTMSEHKHRPEKPKDHGFKEPNNRINAFIDNELLSDKYPNVHEIGFRAQAFIDVTLEKGAFSDGEEDNFREVKESLRDIDGVVMVYTVFGDIDFRCKVVGIDLQDIDLVAINVRGVKGVRDSSTSIILDDTNYKIAREKWARMICNNMERLEEGLPSS